LLPAIESSQKEPRRDGNEGRAERESVTSEHKSQ